MPCLNALARGAAADRIVSHSLQRSAERLLPATLPQQRPSKYGVRTCAQAQRNNVSSDENQKALQYQIERSAPRQTPKAEQPSHDPKSYEQDLTRRQTKAREWITPWLTAKAQAKSMDALAALRQSTEGLTSEQQDTALKRLLGQSWQVAAAHPVVFDSDEELDSVDQEASNSSNHDSKHDSTWEDGIDLDSSPMVDSSRYGDALQS